MTFFDYTSLNDEVQHGLTLIERIVPILILFILILAIYKLKNKIKDFKNESIIRYTISGLMFFGELAFIIWNYLHSLNGDVRFITTLPLQLCSYAIWGLAIALIIKSEKLFNFLFIFGVVSVLALIFPNLNHGFDSFRYYQLYFSHSLLFVALIYLYKVHNFYPKRKDLINSFILLQGLIVFSLILNILFTTDFLFIGPGNKPIDFAWDWPYHIIQYEGFMAILYFCFYKLLNKIKKNKVVI
ncbi:TIGR02206 family membrane protein [Candidatus Izimaplasma bacterium ZiA1]|uniref:YwaF family protein n=1 Tax=Candidatus Izimoplasma sp. ZiA1 TaxID=2024899 RepID=UPI000BAA43E5|nr:TIGR02206 family membrane protein [Candidatus Izimaplasma bacterium ZiA1]